MGSLGETEAPLPEFLSSRNASTTLLSNHICMGWAFRAEDLTNGATIPNALSVTLESPVAPLTVRCWRASC